MSHLKVMNVIMAQFSAASCYDVPLRFKYIPQHFVLELLCSSLNVRDQVKLNYQQSELHRFVSRIIWRQSCIFLNLS